MNKLALLVREKRKSSAMSQTDLAKVLGITYVTVSRLENGEQIGAKTIRKLASWLNMSTRDVRILMEWSIDNEHNKQT